MVKRYPPRILAAAAATLVLGLSACGTPQTLVPYTPADGVNADVHRMAAPTGHNEVPLKIRTLSIVSEPGSHTGFLNGAITAPTDRDDMLVSVEGRAFTSDNTPGDPIAPIAANLALPGGQLVVLSEHRLTVSAPDLEAGLLAELTLTFRDSEPETLMVPVLDASRPQYASATPAANATASPAAEGQPAPAEGQAAPAEGEPAAAPTPQ